MMRQLRQNFKVPFGLPVTHDMLELGAFLLSTETELVLKSRRVIPGKLLAEGFKFSCNSFADALACLEEK
ncbi:MAG: DUF1731 domain-containing protein [Verrucomicrobiota bacterium]